jgi:hypothetical protein
MLQDLAAPGAFRRQITPNGPLDDHWWVGARQPFPRRIVDEELQAWIGGESIEELARFCLARIDGFYVRVAERFARSRAKYFAEKLAPASGGLLRELEPRTREIFLVRDFRDVVASIFAYNERRGVQGFGRARLPTDAEYVEDWFSSSVDEFVHAWRTRSEGAHLMRYEDLVRQPRETLERTLDYLELEAAPPTLDAMLDSLAKAPSEFHRTSDAQDSIGRWQRDLSTEVRAACERSLAPALREFGYG